jgi:hypothetical protein
MQSTSLAVPGVPAPGPRAGGTDGRFYRRMAYACAAIAFAGFTPTYWAPVLTATFAGGALVHAHGLLFSAWMIFFIVQATTAGSGHYERHRALGYLGISLATAMLLLGLAVAVRSMGIGIAAGQDAAARAFAIVPITIVLFFAATVAAALANVRRPEVHMRLMLVASIAILPPAIARLVFLVLAPAGAVLGPATPPPVALSLVPNFAANLLLVVAIVRDIRQRGRPHPAYLVAGACLLFVQVARVPFASTDAWYRITNWLLTLGG